jgi:hypothetical protein
MKILRPILCFAMICFLLLTPAMLITGAQQSFVDARFVRKTPDFTGTVVIWHVVRAKP